MKQLGSVILPEETVWTNQFNYAPVQQTNKRTLSGTMVFTTRRLQGGQPILLELGETRAWLSYTDLLAITELAKTPGNTVSLNWEGVFYLVLFDHAQKPYEFKPVVGYTDPTHDFYYGTINLITL